MNRKIEELISDYKITQHSYFTDSFDRVYDDKILIHEPDKAKKDGMLEEIVKRKQEILGYFTKKREEEKRQYEEHRRKIDAIEGLKEITAAIDDLSEWQSEFKKSFDDAGGCGVRPYPKYDLEAMYKQYPAAKAYIDAKEYQLKSNVELSMIGERAVERIIDNPGKHEEIMNDMQKELHDFAERHMWD